MLYNVTLTIALVGTFVILCTTIAAGIAYLEIRTIRNNVIREVMDRVESAPEISGGP